MSGKGRLMHLINFLGEKSSGTLKFEYSTVCVYKNRQKKAINCVYTKILREKKIVGTLNFCLFFNPSKYLRLNIPGIS